MFGIAVVYSICKLRVEVSSRVRLSLKYRSGIESILAEGQSNGTYCCFVACIELAVSLCAGRMSSSTRTVTVHVEVGSRPWSQGAVVSGERRGRRTLTLALSRHMVGREDLTVLK